MVQSGQRFNEKVSTFVLEFVATGDEQIQGLVEIEIQMPIEMSLDKLVDFLFRLSVSILKLVQSCEFNDIQPVRGDHIGLSRQQILTLEIGDLTDCRE